MTTIVTRAGKGSPLTHTEVDTNFTNLNTNKFETAAIPLGTLAAPSISFVGDANTGAYSPGADTLAFVTAGSNRVHITSAGLVGIGDSAPESLLHLKGSNATLKIESSVNTGYSSVEFDRAADDTHFAIYAYDSSHASQANNVQFYGYQNGNIQFITNSNATPRLTITSGGLVGIGSNSPAAKLHVSGADSTNVSFNGTTKGVRFDFDATQTTIYGVDNTFFASFQPLKIGGSYTAFAVSGTEAARIDTSGRLLVGTSTDQGNSILQVQGEAGAATAAGVLYLRRGLNTAAIGANVGADLGKIQWGANDGTIGAWIQCLSDATWSSTSDTPSRLVFSTCPDSGSSPVERMRIHNDGRISTGTTSAPGAASFGFSINRTGSQGLLECYRNVGNNAQTAIIGGSAGEAYIEGDGDLKNTNNSYGAISDQKLKENIVDASSQWVDIKTLQVRRYNFKEETGYNTHTQIGLVAQEVELVSPGLVNESPDRDEDGNDLGTVTKSVNYSVLYMKAVKALQEAMERIETLEQRLTAAGID